MSKKILIVEDDNFLQNALSFTIGEAGYEIISAFDGEEAIIIAKEVKPDLILLDLLLPKINGFDVLDQLKSDKIISNIPVIIVSNLGDKSSIKKVLNMGVEGYIIKAHFKLDDIIAKIKQVLNNK